MKTKYFFSLTRTSTNSDDFMSNVFEKIKELLKEKDKIFVIHREREEGAVLLPIGAAIFFYLDKEKRRHVAFKVVTHSEEINVDLTESEVFLGLQFSNGSADMSEFANWIIQTKWNIVKQLSQYTN